jgi:hypothetical protein
MYSFIRFLVVLTREHLMFSSEVELMKHHLLRGPTMKPYALVITNKNFCLIHWPSKKIESENFIQKKIALTDIYGMN